MSSPGASIWSRASWPPSSIRRKLSALSSLFDYLCERNAVAVNPADGVKRPAANGNEGSTPSLGNAQARRLLEAPPLDTLKSVRDRATLATLLYHGIRRAELCRLRVRDLQSRQGVMPFRIKGKREKIRFIPVDPMTLRLISEYLDLAGHREFPDGALFRPVRTTEPERWTNISIRARSITTSSPSTRGRRASARRPLASACIRIGPPPRRMRYRTRRTSPRSTSGSGMATSPPRASTTGARASPRIARRLR
jgi:integrase